MAVMACLRPPGLGVAARGFSRERYVPWACFCPAGRERGHDQVPQRPDQLALSDQDDLVVGRIW